MNKNTGGQREGSLGTWRMEGSSLICTLSTDVTSETSIMTHYITAKDWEPYLLCVISLNSYNQKKKKSLKRKQIPWSEVLCLVSQEFRKWWLLGVSPNQSMHSLHDIVLSLNKCLLPQSSLYKGVGAVELGQLVVGGRGRSLETVGQGYVFRKLDPLFDGRQLLKTGKDTSWDGAQMIVKHMQSPYKGVINTVVRTEPTMECFLRHTIQSDYVIIYPMSISPLACKTLEGRDCVCFCCRSVTHSYLTLCDPMDCSLPGSSAHGILWQEYWSGLLCPPSKGSSWPRDRTHVSCISCIVRWIFYHWATWEAPVCFYSQLDPWTLHIGVT